MIPLLGAETPVRLHLIHRKLVTSPLVTLHIASAPHKLYQPVDHHRLGRRVGVKSKPSVMAHRHTVINHAVIHIGIHLAQLRQNKLRVVTQCY